MADQDISNLVAQLRPVLTRLNRKLRKLSPNSNLLSQSERAVLVLLDEKESLLSAELAVLEKMTPQSMGQLLKHLDALGLITKVISDTDKRKIFISLSVDGKKMIQQVRKEREEWLIKAITAVCTEREQAILLKAIEPLNKLIAYH